MKYRIYFTKKKFLCTLRRSHRLVFMWYKENDFNYMNIFIFKCM